MKKYIFKVKKYVAAQVIWDLFGVACLAVAPLLQEWLFDYGLKSSWKVVLEIVAAYFLLLIFYSIAQFFCVLLAFKGGIEFEKVLKKDFFSTVFNMESSLFYKKSIGEYISLQGNDITALEQDYLEPLIDIIRSVNMMAIYGIVLFFGVDWRLAIVIIFASVAAIFIPRIMGKSLAKKRSTYQQQMATYISIITDLLEGFHLINRVTMRNINNRHEEYLCDTAKKRYIYGKGKSISLGLSELMIKMINVMTFATVATLFYKGEITVGVGVATLSYMTAFIDPISNSLYDVTTMQSMKEVKDNVLEYLQNNKVANRIEKKHLNEGISFRNVTYLKEKFKLENISFDIEKGKKYAIVGHSGAGKSTLLKLIMGYEKPQCGKVEIDDINVCELDLSELISYTDQNEHIYRTGLYNNITVFNSYPKKRIKNVQSSISTKLISELFARTKEENCQCFSGGEKQAIAFMRMVAKDSDIILMDEPFSAMDINTKTAMETYLFNSKEFQGKTVLVVTHDIGRANLEMYDKIIHVGIEGVTIE